MTMGCCGNGLGFSLRSTRSRRDEDDSINQEPTPIDQYLAMRYTADLHTLLSSFSPVVASWTAAENGSGPSQLGLTGRLYSTAPSGGGFIWSTSRKELEIAVALEQADEQLHRLPKCTSNDWNSVAVAEERLLERLYKLKLDMQVMEGDGNCQFRSISQGLYGTQQYHLYVRQKVVGFMERHAEHFSAFLGQEYSTYVSEMSNNRVWGDELTLRAACEAFGVVVNVVTSDTENWFLRYIPQQTRIQHEIFLTYISPVHYNHLKRGSRSDMMRSLSSMRRTDSRIVRAVERYEREAKLPENPLGLLQ